MKLKFGAIHLGNWTIISLLSFYLLAYHLVFSGILNYNQAISNIPETPYLGLVLFGIPFMILAAILLVNWFFIKAPVFYITRNLLFLLFVSNIAGVILYNYFSVNQDFELFLINGVILMWYVISYFIGLGFDPQQIKPGRTWVLFLFGLTALNVLLNLNMQEYRMTVNYDYLGIFLFLGDCFAIWSILTLAQYNKSLYAIPIALIAVICLYFISSRSSLYAFLGVLPLIAFKNTSKTVRYAFVFICLLLAFLVFMNVDYFKNSRMLGFLFTGEDRSMMLRGIILDNNLKDLWSHWILGQYGGHLSYGPFGNYIHNYLSLWRQFGLIPFLLFLILILPIFKFIYEWLFKGLHSKHNFLIYLSVFTIIEIVWTRSYTYSFIWLAIGQFTRLLNNKEINEVEIGSD